MRSRRTVVAIALAAMCAVPGVSRAQAKPLDADIDRLSRTGDSRTVGPDTARVTIIEFFDYSCPVCQTFHKQRADSLKRAVGADVRIAYFTFLLTSESHLRSYHGAEAGLCAAFVGGNRAYTAMSDLLFRRPTEWADALDPGPAFTRFAKQAGVDSAGFADCRSRDAVAPLIAIDVQTAGKFSIDGTPTFIVIPRGAGSAADVLSISGNASIADIMALVAQARAKAK